MPALALRWSTRVSKARRVSAGLITDSKEITGNNDSFINNGFIYEGSKRRLFSGELHGDDLTNAAGKRSLPTAGRRSRCLHLYNAGTLLQISA